MQFSECIMVQLILSISHTVVLSLSSFSFCTVPIDPFLCCDPFFFAASITKTENEVNKMLSGLLSANCEDLEGDQAMNILQECLQIKPINFEKLCLPDLESIQTMNLKSSRRNLPRRSLISVENRLQRIETLKSRQDDENSVHPSTPSSMRSPLASLSALNRQISLSNSSGDPFSAHDIDRSPARNPSLFERSNHLSDAVGIAEQSSVSKLKSLSTENVGAVANGFESPKIPNGDVDSISKISLSNVLNVPQVGDAASSGTHASMEAKDISGSGNKVEVNEKLSCLEAQADAVANGMNALDDEVHIFVPVILCTMPTRVLNVLKFDIA